MTLGLFAGKYVKSYITYLGVQYMYVHTVTQYTFTLIDAP